LIDDDEKILRTMARSIRDEYKVLLARDGEEAMELLTSGSHADAIVMELDLPEKDGPSFHEWLRGYDENLARHTIIATAAQERTRFQSFLKTSQLPTLHKPIAKADILEFLGRVFEEQPLPPRPLNPTSPFAQEG
jgi:CheY-like chemotaxis protein